MTWAFGRNHNHINTFGRNDLVVVNIEAVGKRQGCAIFQVGRDFVFVNQRLVFIGQQNHHHIRRFGGFGNGAHVKTCRHRFVPRCALAQAHHHVYAAVFQVGSMRMTLRAIANNGNGFAFDKG